MNEEEIQQFFKRINKLTAEHKPLFGKMNINQMICHCTDFFRMAKGLKKALEYGQFNPDYIVTLAKAGKTAPTPKGFGQVEGDGTLPTDLENDKKILKEHIMEFSNLPTNFNFGQHPYFGDLDKKKWVKLAIYHLNHHLKQFDV